MITEGVDIRRAFVRNVFFQIEINNDQTEKSGKRENNCTKLLAKKNSVKNKFTTTYKQKK